MNIKGWPERKYHTHRCSTEQGFTECDCGSDAANAMLDECAKAVEGMQMDRDKIIYVLNNKLPGAISLSNIEKIADDILEGCSKSMVELSLGESSRPSSPICDCEIQPCKLHRPSSRQCQKCGVELSPYSSFSVCDKCKVESLRPSSPEFPINYSENIYDLENYKKGVPAHDVEATTGGKVADHQSIYETVHWIVQSHLTVGDSVRAKDIAKSVTDALLAKFTPGPKEFSGYMTEKKELEVDATYEVGSVHPQNYDGNITGTLGKEAASSQEQANAQIKEASDLYQDGYEKGKNWVINNPGMFGLRKEAASGGLIPLLEDEVKNIIWRVYKNGDPDTAIKEIMKFGRTD